MMDTVTIQILSFQTVALVAVLGFLWSLHRDMGNLRKDVGQDIADLRERMARVEGLLEGFVGRPPEPQS